MCQASHDIAWALFPEQVRWSHRKAPEHGADFHRLVVAVWGRPLGKGPSRFPVEAAVVQVM